jgi:hypothetical protein
MKKKISNYYKYNNPGKPKILDIFINKECHPPQILLLQQTYTLLPKRLKSDK